MDIRTRLNLFSVANAFIRLSELHHPGQRGHGELSVTGYVCMLVCMYVCERKKNNLTTAVPNQTGPNCAQFGHQTDWSNALDHCNGLFCIHEHFDY